MASKTSVIGTLANILSIEQSEGYADKAVFGGLDRFLENQANELRPLIGDLARYADLTVERRKTWVQEVLSGIEAGDKVQPPESPQPSVGKPPSRPRPSKPASLSPDAPVTDMRGVAASTSPNSVSMRMRRLGITTVQDLIYHFPFRHNDYSHMRKVSELEPGLDQTVLVKVWESSLIRQGQNRQSTQAILGDDSGNVRAIWFNNKFVVNVLRPGTEVVISGRVNAFRNQLVFESPDHEVVDRNDPLIPAGRLVPVYSTVDKLYQKTLRRFVRQALDAALEKIEDPLPEPLRHRAGLINLKNAIAQAHYPDSPADLKTARYRLAFEELFVMQLAILRRKRLWQVEETGVPMKVSSPMLGGFLKSLPFKLTAAQDGALNEILEDLSYNRPMNRMLQGDVGSGKTVVAAAALLVTVANGYQGVLMVPTEILAEQHFLSLSDLLIEAVGGELRDNTLSIQTELFEKPVTVGLLVGSLTNKMKKETRRRIADGEIDIVVGTHAIVQSKVEVPYLGLAVVDEQHRFGVTQRADLREKGQRPHLLAMSATPIPRSLALTFYGDLDMSTIDEMPPGRQRIRTRYVEPDRREAAYELVRTEVRGGRQAFIVCPLIDESESIQSRSAVQEYERLSTQVFSDLSVGLLHGRMALREKEIVMEQFKRRELDVLVSTQVIEVGIDIPNASVMLIDGADRFGLAQLHQLRGRVGRGEHKSHCILLADDPGEDARERLKIVERLDDGFKLADEDLRIRGPGDYMGIRQSGFGQFRVARLTDQDTLRAARHEANRLLDIDPEISRDEHTLLLSDVNHFDETLTEEFS